MPRNNQIQIRKGSGSEWVASNPVLNSGEPGFETDSNRLKIGLGLNWDDTSYISSDSLLTTVYNKTTSTISGFNVVYISGGQGNLPTVSLSIATADSTSANTYGVTVGDILTNSRGLVITNGLLKNLNTNQFGANKEGSSLWLSPTVSGGLTLTKPYAPNHSVFIGTIVRSHNTQGVVEVKIQNGYELEELHDVAVTGVTNGQFLQYNSASGLWLSSSSGNFSSLTINNNRIVTGTGVANHVAYWNSSSGIVADSGQLYWDNTNNRLGISTTSPESNLHIVGDVTFGNNPKYGGDGFYFSNSSLSVIENNFLNTKIDSNSLSIYGNDEGGAGTLQFFSVDRTNGRVGIGIGNTTPAVTLDVLGDGRFSTDLTVGGNLTVNGSVVTANVDRMEIEDPIITLGLASGNIVITDTLDRGLALVRGTGLTAFMGWDSSATQFVMLSSGVASNSSGNYDAGTYGNLQINNLNANDGSFSANLYAKNTTVGYDNYGNYATNGILFNVGLSDTGQEIITVNKGSNFSSSYIYLNAITSFNTPGLSATPLIIHPTGYGGSGAVTQGFWRGSTIEVDKGGTGRTSYSNGQLLIGSGTSLAANTLTATSGIGITNGSGTITIGVTGIPSSTITNFNSGVSGLLPTIANSGDNRILTSTGSTVGINAESNLTFNGNLLNVTGSGSFSSTVTSSGFVRSAVGVSANDVLLAGGTSSPQSALSVGSASVANAATHLNGGLSGSIPYQSNTSATTFVSIGSNGQFLTSNGSAPVWTSNPVTGTGVANHIAYWNSSSGIVADSGQLYWDSTNNRLGIGTNSPTTSIHTTGNIRGSGLIINGLDLTSGGQSPSIDLRGYAWFGKSDGSVGIGVNHNDSGTFDSASNFYSFQGFNATVTSYNPICFTASYDPSVFINTDGNVGIGTATPESKLHVLTDFSCGSDPKSGGAGMYVDGSTGSVSINDNGPQAIASINENGLTLYANGAGGGTEILSTDRTNLRIGIGTITPSSTLHVVGNTNIDGNLTFDSFTESVVSNGNSGTSKTLSLTSGTVHTCTLTGNCTFTMPTATAGKSFTMFLNTGSGNYTASFSGVRWADSAIPTATILASKVDIYSFISDGSYWYGSFSQNYG